MGGLCVVSNSGASPVPSPGRQTRPAVGRVYCMSPTGPCRGSRDEHLLSSSWSCSFSGLIPSHSCWWESRELSLSLHPEPNPQGDENPYLSGAPGPVEKTMNT